MQTQTSNTLHNAIMEAGSKDHPPMLAPGNYVQWKSRIKRYIDTKPNHELIHYCLENPPYKLDWKDVKVPVFEGSPITITTRIRKTYKNVLQDIRDQLNAEAKAVQIILTGIDNDIYSTVDACPNASEMWKAIERLKQGESINVQDLQTNLYWEYRKFTSQDARECQKPKWPKDVAYHKEKMILCKQEEAGFQLNAEQANWKDDTDDEPKDQEVEAHYMYMAQIQEVTPNAADNSRPIFDTEPLQKLIDIILFIVDSGCSKHMTENLKLLTNFVEKFLGTNSSTRSQQATTQNRGKAIVNSLQPIYDQEPSMVVEDDETSKDKEIDKLMALISLSFKKTYKPTNNNLRTSSNTSRENQDNSPRINRDAGYENQRNGNIAGARETVGSSVVQKSRIQCYNCKEFRHVARECQKSKRAKDAAYHREKMLLCKQEEAGIQLNEEQAHWRDDTDDDELEDQELEAHYIEEIDQNDDDNDLAKERELLASLIEKLKCEIDESKNRNNFWKHQIELARRNSTEYASQMELECAKVRAPDTDEVIRLEKESQSKLSDLIGPFDYTMPNNLYDLFVPQREKSYEQRYFSERSRLSHINVNNGKSKESFNKQITLLKKRMDESIPLDKQCQSSLEIFKVKSYVNTIISGVELCKQKIANRTYIGYIDPLIQSTIESNFCPVISRISAGLNQFHKCLNEEMVADSRYFNSLESEVNSLRSQLETQKT
nr:hypothetical protein [Tanacetum cinerariifolium]